jgi:hypothetical protein
VARDEEAERVAVRNVGGREDELAKAKSSWRKLDAQHSLLCSSLE